MFEKLLIANRGEIACRIARTCRRLGIPAATVHSSVDRNALHVQEVGESIEIGGAPAVESYLNTAAILETAIAVGADAIHPGIGFLSEDPEFAEAVEAAGLVFVGPRPETMRCFSDKWSAKGQARLADVPVIDGSEGSFSDPEEIEERVRQMPLPVMLKAVAGGGGRGVRVIKTMDGLSAAIASAMREASASFGRPDLLIEGFVENARHIEVQVAGDGQGNVLHLFERECSLQRRFQKIIEEAPAEKLPSEMRERILEAAVRLAATVEYRGLGTVEFLIKDGEYYFLECNPRLQVEHTVTEAITGLDLVELQLHIASKRTLPMRQNEVTLSGHAIQGRVYAESSAGGFIPSTGTVLCVDFPKRDLRVDSGVKAGSTITSHYDPMIAKLVAYGNDRGQALAILKQAVRKTVVLGLETNLDFLSSLLRHPVVVAGTADNGFIDREIQELHTPPPPPELAAIASILWMRRMHTQNEQDPWSAYGSMVGWRLSDGIDCAPSQPAFLLRNGSTSVPISFGHENKDGSVVVALDGVEISARVIDGGGGHYEAALGSRVISVCAAFGEQTVYLHSQHGSTKFAVEPYLSLDSGADSLNGVLSAQMMGKVVQVYVKAGDKVAAKAPLIVQESMKMELTITAPFDGTVVSVGCREGDLIERNHPVIEIAPTAQSTKEST